MQPAVVKVPILFGDVMDGLTQSTASPMHHFWPLEYGPAGIRDEIRERIAGHHQLADALLLDLAIRHAGRFATFDRRVPTLLPADSANARLSGRSPPDSTQPAQMGRCSRERERETTWTFVN
jgi:hypothetical protein